MNRTGAWIVGIAVTTLVILLVGAILYSAQTTSTIRQNQRTSIESLTRIKDCTEPGGRCFERGQRATADAVGDINRVAIFAAACADQPRRQTVEQIQSCVIDKLSESTKGHR
jgi:hypothetical protein